MASKPPAAEKESKSPPAADPQKKEESPPELQSSEQKLPTSSEPSLQSPGTQSPSERYHGGRRILCAFDGSDGSRAAFDFVREKLATLGDSIILFQALEPMDRETCPSGFPFAALFVVVSSPPFLAPSRLFESVR
jgi:hypothetical protein